MTRERLLWAASAVLLIWIGLLTLDNQRAIDCALDGGRWETLSWRCIPDPGRLIIQRDIRRS